MGWMIILFDLPTNTKEERHTANKFRKGLLDEGYLMLQYSVYARCAVSYAKKNVFINQLKKICPYTGNIQCFFITDAQWGQCITLSCPKTKSKRQIKNQSTPDQLQFW